MTKIHGYGADLEITDDAVVLHLAKIAAKISHADTLTVPFSAITGVHFRKSYVVSNGEIKFAVEGDPTSYAPQPNTVPANAFVVHFRHKDREAFTAAYEQIRAKVPANA